MHPARDAGVAIPSVVSPKYWRPLTIGVAPNKGPGRSCALIPFRGEAAPQRGLISRARTTAYQARAWARVPVPARLPAPAPALAPARALPWPRAPRAQAIRH